MLSDIPTEDRDCPVRNRCIELMDKYSGDELLLKIAQSTADEWVEMYTYAPFVQSAPRIIREYQAMGVAERKQFDKDNPNWVVEDEEMSAYANKKNRALAKVESDKGFLKAQAELLAKDVPRRDKIRQVLSAYPVVADRMETPTVDWDN